jgi:hypothetical protein
MKQVEYAAQVDEFAWRTSSYSSGEGGECVEVAAGSDAVLVRDSKLPDKAQLVVSAAGWRALVAGV